MCGLKIEVFRAEDKQWYFHVKARNGRLIAASEGYRRRADAYKTIDKLTLCLSDAQIVERVDS